MKQFAFILTIALVWVPHAAFSSVVSGVQTLTTVARNVSLLSGAGRLLEWPSAVSVVGNSSLVSSAQLFDDFQVVAPIVGHDEVDIFMGHVPDPIFEKLAHEQGPLHSKQLTLGEPSEVPLIGSVHALPNPETHWDTTDGLRVGLVTSMPASDYNIRVGSKYLARLFQLEMMLRNQRGPMEPLQLLRVHENLERVFWRFFSMFDQFRNLGARPAYSMVEGFPSEEDHLTYICHRMTNAYDEVVDLFVEQAEQLGFSNVTPDLDPFVDLFVETNRGQQILGTHETNVVRGLIQVTADSNDGLNWRLWHGVFNPLRRLIHRTFPDSFFSYGFSRDELDEALRSIRFEGGELDSFRVLTVRHRLYQIEMKTIASVHGRDESLASGFSNYLRDPFPILWRLQLGQEVSDVELNGLANALLTDQSFRYRYIVNGRRLGGTGPQVSSRGSGP